MPRSSWPHGSRLPALAALSYVVQEAIASLHADEPRDWPQIGALYGELSRLTDSPVVELNRAIAVAEEQGPQAELDIVDRLAIDDNRYLHSTRGELLRRLGRTERLAMPSAGRWRWSTTAPSGACSSGGWRSSAGPAPPGDDGGVPMVVWSNRSNGRGTGDGNEHGGRRRAQG